MGTITGTVSKVADKTTRGGDAYQGVTLVDCSDPNGPISDRCWFGNYDLVARYAVGQILTVEFRSTRPADGIVFLNGTSIYTTGRTTALPCKNWQGSTSEAARGVADGGEESFGQPDLDAEYEQQVTEPRRHDLQGRAQTIRKNIENFPEGHTYLDRQAAETIEALVGGKVTDPIEVAELIADLWKFQERP